MGTAALNRHRPKFGHKAEGARALFQRGLSFQRRGLLEEAVAAYAASVLSAPDPGPALYRMAAAQTALGRHAEAVDAWARLHQSRPADPQAAFRHGQALLAAQRPGDALPILTAACETHPNNPALLRLNARALLALNLRRAAIGALYLALESQPGDCGLHAELGHALFTDGHAETARGHCHEAFRQDPNLANAATLSCVLIDLGRDPEALRVAEHGLQQNPNALELLLNRSIALEGLGKSADAVVAARRALAAAPQSPLAQHHLAAALLAQGDMSSEAWALYEGRLHLNGASVIPNHERRWTGGDVNGRTILLHAEQGIGDTLQFVRYAPLVAARGAKVVLAVQPSLARLLQHTPSVDKIVAIGENLPPFDLYAPLLSLPGLFGTTLDTIPPALPYAIRSTVPARGAKLLVGLVWAGNPEFIVDRKRSIAPTTLAHLADIPGVTFHPLQFAPTSLPPGLEVVGSLDGVRDFADTAARIAHLDLVIAVDTAVAHLAATMGKPVWLLSRFRGCWRWLRDREDSPWYPSVRIFRQPRPNDWDSVLQLVRQQLVLHTAGV